MKIEKDILICTVGTSLLSNIKRDEALKNYKLKSNWIGLSKELLHISPKDKKCGAEINSITSLIEKNYLHKNNELYLLVSDTDNGKDTGEILKLYYENHANQYRFKQVFIEIIEGLTDSDFKSFRNKGLKNLLIKIADISRAKGPERIIINATGGYKAQISFAGLIGQALEIPVMYMFETFPEIIALPPQPLSFNFDLWMTYYEDLELLSLESAVLAKNLYIGQDERMASLIERERIDDEEYISLSPIGLLFHEGFKSRFQREKHKFLPPEAPKEKRKIILSEHFYHNAPVLAEELIKKIFREKKYIISIRCVYANPDLPEKSSFKIDPKNQAIIFTYSDRTKTAKFLIEISKSDDDYLKAALIDLTDTYLKK